jgi:hypothetical protein
MTLNITNSAAQSMCNNLVDLLDNTVGDQPTLVVYSGTVPVEADSPLGANNTLVTLLLDGTEGFQTAVDDTGVARSTVTGLPLVATITATGTATFFRMFDDAGTVILQGTVGTAGADLILDTVALVQDATFQVTSLSINVPEQGA